MEEIKDLKRLNYGSGESKLEGYINIDKEPRTKPDLIHDIKLNKLPFEDDSMESVLCLHQIEHLEIPYWTILLSEFYRVLKAEGSIAFAYPEFSVCAKNFTENYLGNREFWRRCLYGRQQYPGDYHVVPMDSQEFVLILKNHGFKDIKHKPEEHEPHNTFLIAVKDSSFIRLRDQEDLIKEEVFRS